MEAVAEEGTDSKVRERGGRPFLLPCAIPSVLTDRLSVSIFQERLLKAATTSSRKATDHPRRKGTVHLRLKDTEHHRRRATEVATEEATVADTRNSPARMATSSRSTCSSRCMGSRRLLDSVAEGGVRAEEWVLPVEPLLVWVEGYLRGTLLVTLYKTGKMTRIRTGTRMRRATTSVAETTVAETSSEGDTLDLMPTSYSHGPEPWASESDDRIAWRFSRRFAFDCDSSLQTLGPVLTRACCPYCTASKVTKASLPV